MAQAITSEAELKRLILGQLKVAVDYVVQKIWNENRELIRQIVYGAGAPEDYERTWEFKEAWDTNTKSFESGNSVEGKFFYEPRSLEVNYSKWQHGSDYLQEPMTTYLADIIYNGTAGKIFGDGYWTKKRDAWKALDNWLTNTQFRKIFEEGMTKAGISWERRRGAVTVIKDK